MVLLVVKIIILQNGGVQKNYKSATIKKYEAAPNGGQLTIPIYSHPTDICLNIRHWPRLTNN